MSRLTPSHRPLMKRPQTPDPNPNPNPEIPRPPCPAIPSHHHASIHNPSTTFHSPRSTTSHTCRHPPTSCRQRRTCAAAQPTSRDQPAADWPARFSSLAACMKPTSEEPARKESDRQSVRGRPGQQQPKEPSTAGLVPEPGREGKGRSGQNWKSFLLCKGQWQGRVGRDRVIITSPLSLRHLQPPGPLASGFRRP